MSPNDNRLALRLRPEDSEIVDSTMKAIGAKNHAQMIRYALNTFANAVNLLKAGYTIFMRNDTKQEQFRVYLDVSADEANVANKFIAKHLDASNGPKHSPGNIQVRLDDATKKAYTALKIIFEGETNKSIAIRAMRFYAHVVQYLAKDGWYLVARAKTGQLLPVEVLGIESNILEAINETSEEDSNSLQSVNEAEQLTKGIMQEVGASACTFYVVDPASSDHHHLLFSPGVKYKELLPGSLCSARPSALYPLDEDEIFVASIANNQSALCKRSECYLINNREEERKKVVNDFHIFGDFPKREDIVSTIRMQKRNDLDNEFLEAVLFVNFKATPIYNDKLKSRVRFLFEYLVSRLEKFQTYLEAKYRHADRLLLSLALEPVFRDRTLTETEFFGEAMRRMLNNIIKRSSADIGNVYARIYLYDRTEQSLKLAANTKDYPSNCQSVIKLHPPTGVAAWVAFRYQPLVIENFPSSIFSSIEPNMSKSILSMIAVPMLDGKRLVGVLCLESDKLKAFGKMTMQHVWIAANRLGSAYMKSKLERQMNIYQTFTEATSDDPVLARNYIAAIVAQNPNYKSCEIWRYHPDSGKFTDIITSTEFVTREEIRPRKSGWTEYIKEHRQPVFIGDIEDNGRVFSASIWKDNQWKELDASMSIPSKIDTTRAIDLSGTKRTRAELGVPLILNNKLMGVWWLKYSVNVERPMPALLSSLMDTAQKTVSFLRPSSAAVA